MSRLVFVSTELTPYTPGASGRVMRNMLRALDEADRKRTTLVMVDAAVDATAFKAAFPHVELVEVDTRATRGRFTDSRHHPPASAYSNTLWHWRSACVFRALAELSKSGPIDYLEFPDLGGLAFCTLQECRLQGFLSDATVAVRLHGSHTALLHAEARPLAIADLNLSDLERKCLRDCDYVVTPSLAVSEAVRDIFDFPVQEWEPRVLCHVPFDRTSLATDTVPASMHQALVFASEFQRSGRPDLFVRGVVGLMRNCPQYTGAMTLDARSTDEAYRAQIERLVPPALVERAVFLAQAEQHVFAALAANATVVFPGAFEAAATAALDVSLQGGRVILNKANPAFGEGTPWLDGINCLKFDGTPTGLVEVLERNFARNEKLVPVRHPESPWPWLTAAKRKRAWRALGEQPPLVSVVVPHYNLGGYLPATLENLIGQNYGNIEILVVDDASTDAQSVLGIDELARSADPRVKVIRLAANAGLAGARNVGVRHATGPYVLTLDADDLIHPRFLEVGVAALENNAEFDIVVTPAGYFIDGDVPPVMGAAVNPCRDYAMFSGEAVVAGLLENRFSTATALFRRSAMERFPYLESLSCYEDWSLFMRMCDAGLRSIVTTDVFFFYRKRRNSMVHTPRDLARRRIEYSDLLRTSASASLRQKSRQLVVGLGSAVAGNQSEAVDDSVVAPPRMEPTAEELISGLFGSGGQYDEQIVFASLKASRWLERNAPWVIRGGVLAARWTWQAYRFVRRK